MAKEAKEEAEIPQLGKQPEGRIQRYFCIDDEKCQAFARVSKDTKVQKRTRKVISVMGKEVEGWIVEVLVPATDGTVRMDPLAEEGKI